MHRLDYMTPIQRRVRYPRWMFYVLFVMNVGVAVYCFTHDRHAFTAVGGMIVGGALLWNLYHALNHDEIQGGRHQPFFTRIGSPFGYWVSLVLYAVLYILTLVVPPIVRYSDSL